MRWSRGLFRLWVVLSAVWVLGAGTGSWLLYESNHPTTADPWAEFRLPPAPTADIPPGKVAFNDQTGEVLVLSPEGQWQKPPTVFFDGAIWFFDGSIFRPMPQSKFEEQKWPGTPLSEFVRGGMIEVRTPDGTVVQFPAGTSHDIIKQVMRENFGGAKVSPSPKTTGSMPPLSQGNASRIIGHIAVPLAPPIFVLIVGWALAWVARGFRPPDPTATH